MTQKELLEKMKKELEQLKVKQKDCEEAVKASAASLATLKEWIKNKPSNFN